MGFTTEVIDRLNQPLDAGRVAKRQQGRNGPTLSYLEGYDVINTANEVFGYDGWQLHVNRVEQVAPGIYYATVGVEVGGIYRYDVGVGLAAGDRPESQETAIKAAVTDGMKRAFRTFGNQFGNSLYDKDSPLHSQAATAPAPTFRAGNAPSQPQRPAPQAGSGGISDKQVAFAKRLAGERGLDAEQAAQAQYNTPLAQLSKRDASEFIGWLQQQPTGNDSDDVPF